MTSWSDTYPDTVRICAKCRGFYFIEPGRGTHRRRNCFVCSPADERRRESWRLSKRRNYVANKIRRALSGAA